MKSFELKGDSSYRDSSYREFTVLSRLTIYDLFHLKTSILVNGDFTAWSNWGSCSKTCGSGIRTRSRSCTNPTPAGAGKNCAEQGFGDEAEVEVCNTEACPG